MSYVTARKVHSVLISFMSFESKNAQAQKECTWKMELHMNMKFIQ